MCARLTLCLQGAYDHCLIYENRAESGVSGGGLFIEGGYTGRPWPTVSNSIVSVNGAGFGTPQAAPYVDAGGGIACVSSSPTITNCIIANNAACLGTPGDHSGGLDYPAGGIYVESATDQLTVHDCAIVNNQAAKGGGIYAVGSDVQVQDCLIAANLSSYSGAGLRCEDCEVTLERVTVSDNVCLASYYPEGGGGIYWHGNTIGKLLSCGLAENTAYDGAALLIHINNNDYPQAESTILNCTFADNEMTRYNGSTVYNQYTSHIDHLSIYNCILWGNVQEEDQTDLYRCRAHYSDVEVEDGDYPGADNIQTDPEFFSTAYGYHHIQHYEALPELDRSPCVDAGDPTDPGLGSDIDGEPRKLPGGTGQNRVDMGSDEAHPFKASLRISKSTPGQGGAFTITLTWNSGARPVNTGAVWHTS